MRKDELASISGEAEVKQDKLKYVAIPKASAIHKNLTRFKPVLGQYAIW